MKVLVIPDVHGSHEWERIKSIPKTDYDKVVFLGDFFDSGEFNEETKSFRQNNKWPDQGENFRNICDFIREDPANRKAVFGNHCWSYLSGSRDGSNCSGHQNSKIGEIRALLNANYDILDIAEEFDGWVFSHAGFTKTWVDSYLKYQLHVYLDKWPEEDDGKVIAWDESEYSIQFMNDFFHKLTHWPGDPNFKIGIDELLDWHGYFSGSGNEKSQGPFWVRPESLLADAYYPNQVVGHTEYAFFGPIGLKEKGNKVILTDSSTHSNIFIFDTENPGDFINVTDFNRKIKKITKVINDGKSMQKSKEDIKNDLIEQSNLSSDEAELTLKNIF